MKTLALLRLIHTPFVKETEVPDESLLIDLYEYALKNRMPQLYLDALKKNQSLFTLESIYKETYEKYLKAMKATAKVARLLQENGIPYATFKTVRPYKSTTVDIDIVIFGDRKNYIESIQTMLKAEYDFICFGPWSTTLWDKEASIGIDLYEQIAVSFIIYLDKQILGNYLATKKLHNDRYVKTLKPEADLACIVAHSLIKEQIYPLSEYYTFIYYLRRINIDDFVKIVRQNNLISATRTHASLTALLHKMAHGTIPSELQQILDQLGEDWFETSRMRRMNFETPHKYHSITVVKSLLEITKGKKTRKSMAMQIYRMLNPNFTKKFLKELLQHIKRETY